jgi:hypothetical protein
VGGVPLADKIRRGYIFSPVPDMMFAGFIFIGLMILVFGVALLLGKLDYLDDKLP